MKKAFSCAMIEFRKWLFSSRMIINAVLVVFIQTFAVQPLLTVSEMTGEPLNVLEPFIAAANSGAILLIIPLTFMTLIADFPRTDTNTVLIISRTGRISWLLGQIIKLAMMAAFFISVIFAGAVLPMVPKGFWHSGWSNAVVGFSVKYPEKAGSFAARLVPENLYNQLSVFEAAVQSSMLIFAYLMIIGLVLLLFTLVRLKTAGFFVCGGIILLGTALCSIRSRLMWALPMANSVVWLHYTKYYREPILPVWASAVYLSVLIILLTAGCFIAVKEFSYDNIIG